MNHPGESAPQQPLPALTDEQKDFIGSALLNELGFADYVDQTVNVHGVEVVAGQFLREPRCFQHAFPMAINHMQLKADSEQNEAAVNAYNESFDSMRTTFGRMLGLRLEEEPQS